MRTIVKRFPISGGRLLAALGVALIAARSHGLNLSIESEQNIFEQDSGPWSGGHAATIVQTTDGTIVAAWRRDNDRVPNNEAWMSTLHNGRWTLPRIIATGSESGDDYTLENVVLFQPKGGALMLFYYTGPKPVFDRLNMHDNQENMWGVLKTSTDNGVTWSAPRALGNDPRIAGGRLCGPTKNPPLQLPDGTILIPSGNEPGLLKEGGGKLSHPVFDNLTWHFETSADMGKTWSLVQVLPANKTYRTIQPGLLVLGGGKLLALGRNEGKGSDTPMATSTDWGKTWSNISGLAALPQSHSGIAPRTLGDGTHICILNKPVPGGPPRDQLDLMVSSNGADWKLGLPLNPAGDGKVANYPQVIQAADGRLHVVFTYAKQHNAQTWRERVIRHVVVKTGEPAASAGASWKDKAAASTARVAASDPGERIVVKDALPGVCTGVDYSGERVGGYLGNWVDRNIADELLGFPLDIYLKPLRTLGPNDSLVLGKTARDEYRQVVGEYLGKYMHAMVLAYDYSSDSTRAALKSRMDEIVAAWRKFQRPNGSLSVVQEGSPSGKWLWWEAKYCLLGMLEYYGRFGGAEVLTSARRHGDFICDNFTNIKKSAEGDGVMLEALVLLYRYTGDPKHLNEADWMMTSALNEVSVIPLLNGGPAAWSGTARRTHDGVKAAHGYVTMSIVISILQLYKLTGEDPNRLAAVKAAVEDISARELYITGGSTWKEHFHGSANNLKGEQADFPQEACAAAHWLYLNRELFHLTGDCRYVDNIELALYNGFLGSENPRNGFEATYYSPLQGSRTWVKTTPKNIPDVHFFNCTPCCTTSSTREVIRIPEYLWARYNDHGLAILIYNPGRIRETIKTSGRGQVATAVTIASDFPKEGQAVITVKPEADAAFKVNLRVPNWCAGFTARVKGTPAITGKPGTFVTIDRMWSRAGETIDVSFDLPIQVLDGGANYPNHKALRRGSQVLVVDQAVNPALDFANLKMDVSKGTRLATEPTTRLPSGWVGTQVYSTPALNDGTVYLVPYADAGQSGASYWTWINQ